MQRIIVRVCFLILSIFAISTAASAHAAIVWSAPAAFTTADAALNQTGTILSATGWGYTTTNSVTLSNGTVINFLAGSLNSVGSPAANGAADTTGAGDSVQTNFTPSSGNTKFDNVLNGFVYDGGPHIITLFGLNAGNQYSVQLFTIDDRGFQYGGNTPILDRYANLQDPNTGSDVSAFFSEAANVYVTGTFIASGSTQQIIENFFNGPQYPSSSTVTASELTPAILGNTNALVIRQLTTASPSPDPSTIPEPSPLNILLAGAVGLAIIRWWQSHIC